MPDTHLQKDESLFFLLLLTWMFLFCHTNTLSAQDGVMHHLDSEDGLAGLTVYRGIESKAGYMWFATDKGLCRYDGESFKTYYSKDSPDSEIIAVWEFDEKIWFINLLFQLFYLEDETINRFNPDGLLTDVRVHELFVDHKNRYWLSSVNTLYKFEINESGNFIKEEFSLKTRVRKVFSFKSGEIGVISKSVYLYDEKGSLMDLDSQLNNFKNNKNLNSVLINSQNYPPCLIQNNQVTYPLSKFEDLNFFKSGNLQITDSVYWFASDKGVFRISKSFELLEDYTKKIYNNRVNNLFEDRNGNIWFCTNGEGIFILQNESIQNCTSENSDLPSSFVYKVAGDKEGHIYLASKNGWLSEFKKDQIINYKITNSNADFYDLQVEDKEVKILCDGFYSISKNKDGKLEKPNFIQSTFPKAMTRSKNDLWVASHEGIFKCTDAEYEHISPFRSYAMYKGYNNTMWIGTVRGLYRFDYNVPFQLFNYDRNNNQSNSHINSINPSNKKLIYDFSKRLDILTNRIPSNYKIYE